VADPYLDTLNADEVIVSHALVAIRIPDYCIFPSGSVKNGELKQF
jgi:hypothetical protein